MQKNSSDQYRYLVSFRRIHDSQSNLVSFNCGKNSISILYPGCNVIFCRTENVIYFVLVVVRWCKVVYTKVTNIKGGNTVKELNEFLDEQYQVEERESFKVDTPSKADWALGKIKGAKEQQDKNILLANEKIEQINEWLKDINGSLQNDIDFFQSHLAVYAQLKREEDPNYKSEKLPSGRIRFKKQQPAYKYDEAVTIQWLKDNDYDDLITVKEAPKKTDIKKRFLPHNGKLIDAELGMEVEGVTIEEQPDKFEVEVK